MSVFWVMRNGLGLRAWGAESDAMLSKLPFGKPLHVEVKQPRNSKHLALYWVLCKRIADGIGSEDESVSDVLKIKTGHVRRIKTKDGIIELPGSISFANLDQTGFNTFFDKCVNVITTEWGIARADILELVKDLLDEKNAA